VVVLNFRVPLSLPKNWSKTLSGSLDRFASTAAPALGSPPCSSNWRSSNSAIYSSSPEDYYDDLDFYPSPPRRLAFKMPSLTRSPLFPHHCSTSPLKPCLRRKREDSSSSESCCLPSGADRPDEVCPVVTALPPNSPRSPTQVAAGIAADSPMARTRALVDEEFLALRSCCLVCQAGHSAGLLPDDQYREQWTREARKKRKKDLDLLNATEAEAKERGEREADEDRPMMNGVTIDVDEVDKVPVEQRRASREGEEDEGESESSEGDADADGETIPGELIEMANSLGLDLDDGGKEPPEAGIECFRNPFVCAAANDGSLDMAMDDSAHPEEDDDHFLPPPPRSTSYISPIQSASSASQPEFGPPAARQAKRRLSWANIGRGLSWMRGGSNGGVSINTAYAAGCF
jgi:hypothetical protein